MIGGSADMRDEMCVRSLFFSFFLNELKREKARERSRNTRDKISRLVLIDSKAVVHKKGQKKNSKRE